MWACPGPVWGPKAGPWTTGAGQQVAWLGAEPRERAASGAAGARRPRRSVECRRCFRALLSVLRSGQARSRHVTSRHVYSGGGGSAATMHAKSGSTKAAPPPPPPNALHASAVAKGSSGDAVDAPNNNNKGATKNNNQPHHHGSNGAAGAAAAPDARAKQVLKEAVDAVVNSFAKHTQGYGRGKHPCEQAVVHTPKSPS